MKKTIGEWRESKDYLPDFLKDFHDQKDFFKAMHMIIDVGEHQYCKDITWVAGHCYIIDIFLWFLSRYGYKIQKTRADVDFLNLRDDIDLCVNKRIKSFLSTLNKE